MSTAIRTIQQSPRYHEQEFIRRYDFLFYRCLQLTKKKDLAEDLLHDGYVQFTITRPDLAEIEDLDGYLCRVLRNLHYARLRLATWSPKNNLSLIDYDSAEMALRSTDFSAQIQTQQELLRICRYAFIRRATCKNASILTLRYFLGYYPSEIAKVVNGNQLLVRRLLADARKEVKGLLANSLKEKEGAMELPRELGLAKMGSDISDVDFLKKLRRALFLPKNGCCIPSSELKACYRDSKALSGVMLAHIVHCAECLDEVNRMRGLPSLSDRQTDDREGRENPPRTFGGNGGPPSSAVSEKTSKELERRKKETFEHLPGELKISVNGIEIGGQSVTAALNELRLAVNIPEKITFIEIYSEFGVRLLFMDVEPFPDGPIEQTQTVHLSDGRRLQASLSFIGSMPGLEVSYHDPILERNIEQREPEFTRPTLVRQFAVSFGRQPFLNDGFKRGATWWVDAWTTLLRFGLFRPRFRTGWMASATAVVLAVALLIYEVRPDVVSAAELLNRSSRAEQQNAPTAGWVLRRSLNLEEFSPQSVNPISHHKIEVWEDPGKGVCIRRLFDDRNHVLAEERVEADGTTKVYGIAGAKKNGIGGSSPVASILQNKDAWRLDLSADSFASLIGDPKAARATKAGHKYFIEYEREKRGTGSSSPGLLKATLTLDESSFHAREERLVIEEGASTREFRISEEGLLRVPANIVDPRIFELSLPPSNVVTQPESLNPNATPVKQVATDALLGLKVEALYRLSRLSPELENQIRVERTQDGRIRVQGIVDSDERKAEILSALQPILKDPAMVTELKTVWEALKTQAQVDPEPIITREVTVTNASIPVRSELARYFNESWKQDFESRSLGTREVWIEQRIQGLSSNILEASHRSYLHAMSLRSVLSAVSPREVESLDSIHRSHWESLIRSHAEAIAAETRTIRTALDPIFFASQQRQPNDKENGNADRGDPRTGTPSEMLFKKVSENHAVILSAFTVSDANPAVAVSQIRGMRASLLNLEAIARRLVSQ